MIHWRWRLKMPPKLLYPYTKLHGVTNSNVMIMIFTAVVTVKCRFVWTCFSFPVNLKLSVYAQHDPKQISTECYCRLRIVSDIQQTDTHQGYQLWCVCDTALLRFDSIIVTPTSNTNSCVRLENISPFISVLPSYNAISDMYQINTN
jgi:hypothetical protein